MGAAWADASIPGMPFSSLPYIIYKGVSSNDMSMSYMSYVHARSNFDVYYTNYMHFLLHEEQTIVVDQVKTAVIQ